jgi:hypothetical protein
MQVDEVARVRAWVKPGAQVDEDPLIPSPSEPDQIRQWESWLNSDITEPVLRQFPQLRRPSRSVSRMFSA